MIQFENEKILYKLISGKKLNKKRTDKKLPCYLKIIKIARQCQAKRKKKKTPTELPKLIRKSAQTLN